MLDVCFESTYTPTLAEITENNYQLLQKDLQAAIEIEDYEACIPIKRLLDVMETNRK
jgi:hypothetical protein